MHASPLPAIIDTDPPIPFTDEEIGSAAHEKHMPSVRAIAVDPDRGLVLLNLVGADTSVSAVIMELLRSKSNGVGFMPTLFAGQSTNIPTQLTIQHGIRYITFRSALATPDPAVTRGMSRTAAPMACRSSFEIASTMAMPTPCARSSLIRARIAVAPRETTR